MNTLLQRIGAIGDIHTEDRLLAAALRYLSAQNLDALISLGDIVDGPGNINRCVQLLREAGAVAVAGNHERWFLQGEMRDLPDATRSEEVDDDVKRFLSSLPKTLRFTTPKGTLLVCHGLGEDDMAALRPDDFGYALSSNDALSQLLRAKDTDFVLCGHTHRRMVRTIEHLTVINAGTLSQKRNPCFLIADFLAGEVRFFDIDEAAEVREAEVFPLP